MRGEKTKEQVRKKNRVNEAENEVRKINRQQEGG